MRQPGIAVIAFLSFILLPILVNGQDKDASDNTWPSLATAEKYNPGVPRFIIESEKLEIAHEYVFYLPKHDIFYVTRYGSSGIAMLGPFTGDPRRLLKGQ